MAAWWNRNSPHATALLFAGVCVGMTIGGLRIDLRGIGGALYIGAGMALLSALPPAAPGRKPD